MNIIVGGKTMIALLAFQNIRYIFVLLDAED